MNLFFAFILAMFVTTVLILPLMKWAHKLKLVDAPGERKVHAEPVPRVGGIAMVIGALASVMLFLPVEGYIASIVMAVIVLFAFGVWDDRAELSHGMKFLGQILAVSIVIFHGGVLIERIPFHGFDPIPYYMALPITYFALLGITNAINLADGLDGLAGGTTMMSVAIICILAVIAQDPSVSIFCAAVIGSTFGFLRFNTHPARIFMGDTGSQFLGFITGVLVVVLTQKTNMALSPAMPLLLLGFPLLDTFLVMVQRLRAGKSPFVADKNHTHHKLLFFGFDHYEAVLTIYALQALFVSAAYMLRYQMDEVVMGAFLVMMLAVVAAFRLAAIRGWRLHAAMQGSEVSPVTRYIAWMVNERRLPRWSFYVIATTIPAYLFIGAMTSPKFGFDIEILALCLLLILMALFKLQKGQPFNLVERACAYVTCAIIVYFMQTNGNIFDQYQQLHVTYFIVLVSMIVLGMRFSKGRRFELNTMDFLFVLIAVAVPNLHMRGLLDSTLSEGVAMLIVLFYGIEIIIMKLSRKSDLLRYALYVTLGLIGVKGILMA